MATRTRIQVGTTLEPRELVSIRGQRVPVPDRGQFIHLQFRRFAGCPVCDLHLHSIVQRQEELIAASIREVVVFHSTREELLGFASGLPFDVVADPGKRLYAGFGVESGPRALLDPRAWPALVRGVSRSLFAILGKRGRVPSLNPRGGRFGLPADFLIACDGRVAACKYGSHAYDQWPVAEILRLAQSEFSADQVRELRVGNSCPGG